MLTRKSGSPTRLRSKKIFGGALAGVCVCKSKAADEVVQLPFKHREGEGDEEGSHVGFIRMLCQNSGLVSSFICLVY